MAKAKTTDKPKQIAPDTTAEEKELVQREEAGVPDVAMFQDDAGQGFENTGADDYATPFLVILQKNSPQCDDDSPKRIPDAKAGLFFHTASQELLGDSIRVVPVSYKRMFAEWVPRDQGGGFRGHHLPESPAVVAASNNRDERGRFLTDHGTHLMDTRYHFVILIDDDGNPAEAVIAMSSTQIKKSKAWMAAMRGIILTGANGKKFTPPMFSHIYKLGTIAESNEHGTWKGFDVKIDRPLNSKEADIYALAKSFRDRVESGTVKVDEAGRAEAGGDLGSSEEEPF